VVAFAWLEAPAFSHTPAMHAALPHVTLPTMPAKEPAPMRSADARSVANFPLSVHHAVCLPPSSQPSANPSPDPARVKKARDLAIAALAFQTLFLCVHARLPILEK
jgi:hypothetical protein